MTTYISFSPEIIPQTTEALLAYHADKTFKLPFNGNLESDTCAVSDLKALIQSGKKLRTIYTDPTERI